MYIPNVHIHKYIHTYICICVLAHMSVCAHMCLCVLCRCWRGYPPTRASTRAGDREVDDICTCQEARAGRDRSVRPISTSLCFGSVLGPGRGQVCLHRIIFWCEQNYQNKYEIHESRGERRNKKRLLLVHRRCTRRSRPSWRCR